MSKELMWLTYTVVLTMLLWIPYILDRTMVRGLMGARANPSPRDKPQTPWAQRLQAAHLNAVENLVVFAALVLILHAQNHSTQSTVLACAIFFWARLVHAVVYALGIPVQLDPLPATQLSDRQLVKKDLPMSLYDTFHADRGEADGDWYPGERRTERPNLTPLVRAAVQEAPV